jgi:tungstate transport system ATP-binding protein
MAINHLEELGTMSTSLGIKDIEKTYRTVKALDAVSLNAQGGKITVLIGVNGAGKTTLLRIIAGLEKPDTGNIRFNEKAATDTELRQVATLVFQRTALFSRSVYENLAYGLKTRGQKDPEIRQKITEALNSVGLKNFEKRRAKKTSGGEQQRIALARAFLLEPKILLLDEPTANLDPNSARIIEKAILSRKRNDTIIVLTTHNLGQAKRLADQVIHIHQGKIVEAATPKDLFDNPQHETTRKFIRGELEF